MDRARRQFVRKPSPERLHDLRTTGRRLRSLLEDVADLSKHRKLLRRVRAIAGATDAARDAAVIFALLDSRVDDGERATALPLLESLRAGEARATKRARKRLRTLLLT